MLSNRELFPSTNWKAWPWIQDGGFIAVVMSLQLPPGGPMWNNYEKRIRLLSKCGLLQSRLLIFFLWNRFSYDELITAVKEKYCKEQDTVKHYLMLEVQYFEGKLQVRNLAIKESDKNGIYFTLPMSNIYGDCDKNFCCITSVSSKRRNLHKLKIYLFFLRPNRCSV